MTDQPDEVVEDDLPDDEAGEIVEDADGPNPYEDEAFDGIQDPDAGEALA